MRAMIRQRPCCATDGMRSRIASPGNVPETVKRCLTKCAPVARIASPEMFPEADVLPHLICSRPIFIGGAKDEADQHGGA